MISVTEKTGYSESIVWNGTFCGKILTFPLLGKSTSLHYHRKKEEHFWVSSGCFSIQLYLGSPLDYLGELRKTYGVSDVNPSESAIYLEKMSSVRLEVGSDIHIHTGMIHRIISMVDNSSLVEFSTTDYTDDSARIDFKRDWTEKELAGL